MSDASSDVWLDPTDDPRHGGASLGDERTTLTKYLHGQRLTLELKCAGLDADQLARRSVEPSALSLLGLVRHLCEVEQGWFRRTMAGEHPPALFRTAADPDAAFSDARPDPEQVAQAWAAWRQEVAFAERYVEQAPHLDVVGDHHGDRVSLREVLVHMVEEYARHNGHADLLRERIDGRTGE